MLQQTLLSAWWQPERLSWILAWVGACCALQLPCSEACGSSCGGLHACVLTPSGCAVLKSAVLGEGKACNSGTVHVMMYLCVHYCRGDSQAGWGLLGRVGFCVSFQCWWLLVGCQVCGNR